MNVDFQIKIWERLEIPEDKEEVVMKLLKSGKIETAEQLMEEAELTDGVSYIEETGETIMLDENKGRTTVDAMKDGETIYQNGN